MPPNVSFIVDDVEEEWLDTKPYDFIHARYMAVSLKDWDTFVGRVFEWVTPSLEFVPSFYPSPRPHPHPRAAAPLFIRPTITPSQKCWLTEWD